MWEECTLHDELLDRFGDPAEMVRPETVATKEGAKVVDPVFLLDDDTWERYVRGKPWSAGPDEWPWWLRSPDVMPGDAACVLAGGRGADSTLPWLRGWVCAPRCG
jgi:hypothetical protein